MDKRESGSGDSAAGRNDQPKQRKAQVKQTDVPRHSLSEALRVAQTIADEYGKSPTKPEHLASAMELSPSSGTFRMLVGASSAYGLTEGGHSSDVISLTELGRRICAPTEEGMETAAKREALMRPRVIREFLTKYRNSKFPQERIGRNVLEDIGVPADSSKQVYHLIAKGARELGVLKEINGSLHVDLDLSAPLRPDVEHDPSAAADDSTSITNDSSGSTPDGSVGVGGAPTTPSNNRVFITHGKNLAIVAQLKELLTFGNFVPVVAAEHETVSKPVPDKVMDEMRSCHAAIIHVGKERKLLDPDGNEEVMLNQNVLIEIGAAMALYERRFILLVEKGTTLPSNLQGLYEVRYEGDKLDYDATMKLLKAFNDFKR